MENGLFGFPVGLAGRNSIPVGEILSEATPNSLVQFDSFDLNNQNQTLEGYAMRSTLQGEYINDVHRDAQLVNRTAVLDSDALVTSHGGNMVTDDSSPGNSRPVVNAEFQEQFVDGTPISNASLATLLAARSGFGENLNNLAVSGPSTFPLEVLRAYASNDCSNALNYGSDQVLGCTNNKGDYDRFPVLQQLGGRISIRAGCQPYGTIGNSESHGWLSSNTGTDASVDNSFGSCKFSNVLSLSLATSQPSVTNSSIPDQCSEISCSGATRQCLKETGLGSEKASLNSKELSLSCGSLRAGLFSQMISGSKYLHVIQEILAQIASYSLDNLEQMSLSTGVVRNGVDSSFSSSYSTERGRQPNHADESSNLDSSFEVQMDPSLQKRALEAKKAQLLALLQLVDERYSQCMDEIHTVISAFHAATELDPQLHTRFALQTVSLLYKSIREKISNQILAIGAHLEIGFTREGEGSSETSFVQKQWMLQQLKKKDHQIWRPQRGLPERSVSVLRAWMFQNFLHPYPKDAEKHLLAVKSGLTRSQVSNWFINARVRLWKPMIEEMYTEMSRRRALQNEEGTNRSHRGHISISNPRFDVN